MKIAFHRKRHVFLDLESARRRERLAAHEFYDWFAGVEAPTNDLDVVLVVGSLDRRTIAEQSQLFFVATATEFRGETVIANARDIERYRACSVRCVESDETELQDAR